ncbi:hypothetical protein CPB85DRAFT_661030 [Mucidula mucida]|nr:hypothetical protein CPB85DRAFT_661030 [Mucidula mucida]
MHSVEATPYRRRCNCSCFCIPVSRSIMSKVEPQGPIKNATTGYEKYVVQRMNIRMKFQLIATSLLLAVTSPFALPMLLQKAQHLDEGLNASWDTLITAAWVMTAGTFLTLAHARGLLYTYDQKIHTDPSTDGYIFTGKSFVKSILIFKQN